MAKLVFLSIIVCCSAVHAEVRFFQRIRLEQPVAPAGVKVSPLGGISAAHYIESEGVLILLSDDRGEKGEPRAYEFRLKLDTKNKVGLEFDKQVVLKSAEKNVDYEGLAILPWGNLLVASEGDQNHKPRVLPGLMDFRRDGKYVRNYDLPKEWLPNLTGKLKKGIRNNRGLEGLAGSPDGKTWVVAVENYLQGADETSTEMAVYTSPEAWVIKQQSQFLYPIDSAGDAVMAHGVSEVLFKNNEKLWVMERHLSSDLSFFAKIYEIDILAAQKAGLKTPVTKKLVFDLGKMANEEIGDQRGLLNFEGLTWGPQLATGERLLIITSDNNFLPVPTEIWVFKVKE